MTIKDVGSFRGIAGLSDEAVQRLEQLREAVQRVAGTRKQLASTSAGGGTVTNVTVTGGGAGGGSTTPDPTPPPTPTGVVLSAGLTSVVIVTDAPVFTQGHGYGRTKVWGATYTGSGPLPTFGTAVLVHEFVGQVGSFSTNPATEWHLWLKWVSADGYESTSPSGGTNGHVITTGQDPSVLLDLLTGQITESQLYAALGAKIGLIDPTATDTLAESLMQSVVSLQREAQARIDAIMVEAATRAEQVLAEAAARGAAITQVRTEMQTADTSLAQQITTLTAAVNAGDQANASGIQIEATARADADTAEAAQRTLLAAQVQDNDTQVRADFATADAAVYSAAQTWVQSYAYSKSQTDSAIATSFNSISARLNTGGDISTAIVAAQNTASAKNATFKQSSTPTATRVGDTWIDTGNGNKLKSWDGASWVDSDDARIGSTASSVATLQSQVAGTTGSSLLSQIQTEASTRASETGHMSALYTVRVSLTEGGRSVVGGFGISGVSSGTAGPTIDFGVRADRFWIGAPSGTTGVGDILPFVVQTTDQVVNGVTIPKGVYMDAAYIKNLTALVARLGNAWIDNLMVANVSAAKLIAGSIAVGEYIQSSDYSSGTSGWRINGNGNAELNNVTVRGTVYAGAGTIGGITMGSSFIQSSSYSAGATGFRLNADGTGQLAGIAVGQTAITSQNFNGSVDGSGNITSVGTQGWAIAKSGGMVVDAAFVRGRLTTGQLQVGAVSQPIQTTLTSATVALSDVSTPSFYQSLGSFDLGASGSFAGAIWVCNVSLEFYLSNYGHVYGVELVSDVREGSSSGAAWVTAAFANNTGRAGTNSLGTFTGRRIFISYTFTKAFLDTEYGVHDPGIYVQIRTYDVNDTANNVGASSYVNVRATGSIMRSKV